MAKKDINKEKKKSNFFRELKSELKKVSWPTLKKLVNNTSAVVAVVLIVSAIVFILDVCFEGLNNFGIEKLKSLVSTNINENEEITDSEDGIELLPNEENQEESNDSTDINENSESESNDSEEVVQ